jgi:hypothetical protein
MEFSFVGIPGAVKERSDRTAHPGIPSRETVTT